jgi:hypothetical protein
MKLLWNSAIVLSVFATAIIGDKMAFGAGDSSGDGSKSGQSDQGRRRSVDPIKIGPPQVLREHDSLLGASIGFGSGFDGSALWGLNFEHIVSQNIGVGAQYHYASYDSTYWAGNQWGGWEYRASTISGFGSLHGDLIKVRNLDTYVSLGISHTFLTSRWKAGPQPTGYYGRADADFTSVLFQLGFRYFVNSNIAVGASVGTGISGLSIGFDYLLWN